MGTWLTRRTRWQTPERQPNPLDGRSSPQHEDDRLDAAIQGIARVLPGIGARQPDVDQRQLSRGDSPRVALVRGKDLSNRMEASVSRSDIVPRGALLFPLHLPLLACPCQSLSKHLFSCFVSFRFTGDWLPRGRQTSRCLRQWKLRRTMRALFSKKVCSAATRAAALRAEVDLHRLALAGLKSMLVVVHAILDGPLFVPPRQQTLSVEQDVPRVEHHRRDEQQMTRQQDAASKQERLKRFLQRVGKIAMRPPQGSTGP